MLQSVEVMGLRREEAGEGHVESEYALSCRLAVEEISERRK